MAKLKHTKGWRRGATAREWSETFGVNLLIAEQSATILETRMSASYYGTTVVNINIGPKDYPRIPHAMAKTDRKVALYAMAAVLAECLGED